MNNAISDDQITRGPIPYRPGGKSITSSDHLSSLKGIKNGESEQPGEVMPAMRGLAGWACLYVAMM